MLQGVSFDVPEGAVTALLGRNGVGKTTTLRALLGLVPAEGQARLGGVEITREPTHRIVRRGVGYVPEDRDVFSQLSVLENLQLAVRNGSARWDYVYELFPELRFGCIEAGASWVPYVLRALRSVFGGSIEQMLSDNPRTLYGLPA